MPLRLCGWCGELVMIARALLLASLLSLPLASAQVMSPEVRHATLASVVQVVAYSNEEITSFGSGVIVSPFGHVMTNWHVIADEGGRVHRNLWVLLGDPERPDVAPSRFYGAHLVGADEAADLALLHLTLDSLGRRLDPSTRFLAAPIARSGAVMIGDPLFILGFPFISGATVTLTVGTVSGFVGENFFESGRAWIKTDARMQSGNSGGGAFDRHGNLVGIATSLLLRKEERQEHLRPADLLEPVLARSIPGFALVEPGGVLALPTAPAPAAAAAPAPAPAAAGAALGAASDTISHAGLLTPTSDWYYRGRFADAHPLQLEVGSEVRIRLTSGEFDAYLIVLDPDDLEVVNVDDTPGFGTDVDARFVAARRGPYLVIATTAFREQTGRYQLQIDTIRAPSMVATAASPTPVMGPAPISLSGLWSGVLVDEVDGPASLSVTIRAFGEVLDGNYRANFTDGSIAGSVTGLWRDGWAQVLLIPLDDDLCPLQAFAQWDGQALSGRYEGEGCVGVVRGRIELRRR